MLNQLARLLQILKDTRPAILFYLGSLFFLIFGTFQFDLTKDSITGVVPRHPTNAIPFIVGFALFLLAFLLDYKSKSFRKIILYSPTFKEIPFYNELLEQIVRIASSKAIQVLVKNGKGDCPVHDETNYIDLLKESQGKDFKNTVLIMVLPSPKSYDEIFKLDPNMKLNLITLDMEIDPHHGQLHACNFLKKIILVDNKKACQLAAAELISQCKAKKLEAVNIIICEGEFHNRGKYFIESLLEEGKKQNFTVKQLGLLEERTFSGAVDQSYSYVSSTMDAHQTDIKSRPTFIFCANDNMAFGAIAALSRSNWLDVNKVKIISFDASEIIRRYIRNGSYVLFSVEQPYYNYAAAAVSDAEKILKGEKIQQKVELITPKIWKG